VEIRQQLAKSRHGNASSKHWPQRDQCCDTPTKNAKIAQGGATTSAAIFVVKYFSDLKRTS